MCSSAKVISITVPNWVDEEEVKVVVMNYIEEKLLRLFRDSVDRETYLKFLEIMGVSVRDVEFGLKEEMEFLRKMRQKEKTRAFGCD